MWELAKRLSHGRYPLRRFSLVVMSMLMAFFVATFALSTPAYADDAERNGTTISYQENEYAVASSTDMPSSKPAQAKSAYFYLDSAANKAHFIFTEEVDPAKAAKGYYVVYDYTPPSNYSNPSPPTDVTFTAGTSASTSDCDNPNLTGISWWVCPTVNALASGMDWIYGIISNFLVVKTVTGDTDSAIYQMWTIVRDIANICFVIAIIVIVYSQITSIGLTNYGIKHTLSRLIIAAILVNISYWICALAVDASNVLGYGIHSLFMGVLGRLSVGANYSALDPTWSSVATWALGSGAAVGIIAFAVNPGAIFLLIPLLLGAVTAALIALIVLAARQALITVLIIVAPLAFVAYILPNTEKWFTKWRETFTTMLLLFPIFSAIFSGAQLTGMAIIQTADGNAITVILGLAVQVAPIVVTPLLVKFSGSIIGRIAGMVNNPNKGLIDRSRKMAQGWADETKKRALTGRNISGTLAKRKGLGWLNARNRATQGVDSFFRNQEARRKNLDTGAENRFAATNIGQKRTIEAGNLGVDKTDIETRTMDTESGRALMHRQGMSEVYKTNMQNRFGEHTLGKDLDMEKRKAEQNKKRIENDHQTHWDNAVRTDASLLELDLSVKKSESSAALAKEKLEKMHAEIVAQGHNSEYILNLRGIDAHSQGTMLNIAHDLNKQAMETTFAKAAKTEAEHALTSATNDVLLKNSIKFDGVDARKYAAGIGSEAAVLASAVARERKEFGEAVGYQKELASHFKLNAGQIEELAMAKGNVTVTDDHGNSHTFSVNDDYARDMAVEEIFTVGSHGQKMAVLKSTGAGEINYSNRRTIQQAAIKSGFSKAAPAINDKTLDDIINGRFKGDESWQYHSLREVLEGRLNPQSLSTANVASLEFLFADPTDPSNALAAAQFNQLLADSIPGELANLRRSNPAATNADARASLLGKFNAERDKLQRMAASVLDTPTIRQNTNAQSADELKRFAGGYYTGP